MDIKESKGIKKNLIRTYSFGVIAHFLMLIIFIRYKIDIMVYFNIGSIVLYFYLLLISQRLIDYRFVSLHVSLSAIEVILHQVLAIICVGSGIGFEYFFVIIGLSIVLEPKKVIPKQVKIIFCVTIMVILVAMQLHSFYTAPIYQLPMAAKRIFLISIPMVSVFGIFSFCFNQWNVSEGYRDQIEVLLADRNCTIVEMQAKTIKNFADLVESRDTNTGGHIKRTSAYVEAIIQALNESNKYQEILTPEYSKMIVSAAPLHDIGKIAISDSILQKKGKLTDEEYEVMKTHSAIGAKMLRDLLGDMESDDYVNVATEVAKYHHEKWNGRGYPEHLCGANIPLCARIMAIADVFDALTSVRAYKEKFSMEKAYGIMESEAGQQFDADLIQEFVRIRPSIEKIYNTLYEEDYCNNA